MSKAIPLPDEPIKLGSVTDVVNLHCGLTEGALRALLIRRHANGLAPYVIKVGRRVFIDLNGFQRWLMSQREAA